VRFKTLPLQTAITVGLTTWRIDGGKSLWQELSMRLLRTLAVAWTEILFLHKFALVYRLQRRMFFLCFLLSSACFCVPKLCYFKFCKMCCAGTISLLRPALKHKCPNARAAAIQVLAQLCVQKKMGRTPALQTILDTMRQNNSQEIAGTGQQAIVSILGAVADGQAGLKF
jgi:hypothetical protein